MICLSKSYESSKTEYLIKYEINKTAKRDLLFLNMRLHLNKKKNEIFYIYCSTFCTMFEHVCRVLSFRGGGEPHDQTADCPPAVVTEDLHKGPVC